MEDNNLTKQQIRNIKAKERMRRLRKNRNEKQRQLIQKKDTEAHRLSREVQERRRSEQQSNTQAHRLVRHNEDRRQQERIKDSVAHRLVREDEERRLLEQEKNTEAHRFARQDKARRHTERERDSDAHRLARLNEERRLMERERDSDAHRLARLDEERRKLDSDAHRHVRLVLKRRQKEREGDRIARKLARIDLKEDFTYSDLCEQYENKIKTGPIIICNSCCGLFFPSSMITVNIKTLVTNGQNNEFLRQICNIINDKLTFCTNCYRDIIHNKVPNLSKANGLGFPSIPQELKSLTEVEIRLVSPRIPFMQITELSKRDRQYGLKGNVVNVPIPVDDSWSILPRTFDDTHTIQLKLKRKLCYQSYYMYESVRPAVCFNAVKYLIETPLYKLENITISENWLNEHNKEKEDFIVLEEDKVDKDINLNIIDCMNKKDAYLNTDEWEENKEEDNVTTNDTLWTNNDFSQTISFAPGEGKYPLSILRDQYSEELSFPNIYCGQPRQAKKNISYANICKWELRHYDRRCCYVPKLFFMLKKRQIQMITKQASMYLRKRKNTENITAGQLLDKDFVDNICKVDDGYKFLKVDRASPPYWQARKKEVLAMIRQIGLPTLFLTLSAAETRWKELLVILMKTVRNQVITEDETVNLDYKDKCELISKDPVTCSRYFDKRIRELFLVLNHPKGPFNEHPITDTYVRVEFQHRGSPHVHCLIWMNNAPTYLKEDIESINKCVAFIDKYITVKTSFDKTLIELQTHGHSQSCKKFIGDNITCRFDFPQLPMPNTIILEPKEASDEIREQFDDIFNTIKQTLCYLEKQHKNGAINLSDITFNQFLEILNISTNDYILAIQLQLKQPKIYLKRDLNDIRVNCYNEEILKLHRANMDIQFILDPYSCVQYILNYLNKPNRGMSKILREAVEEIKAGNFSIRDRLKIIGDRYLKATEISAQEAVYHLLSMDLSKCSRAHVFINTGEPNTRNRIVKSDIALKELDNESTDIYQMGDLDYYTLRPDSMKNICLADYCSNYNRYNKRPNKKSKSKLNENDNDDQIMEDEDLGEIIVLKNNTGYLEKRKKAKIIRYKRYDIKSDELNFYREQCQLYLPWYNEQNDLINVDIKSVYQNNLELILTNSSRYVYHRKDIAEFENKFKEEEFIFIENENNQQSHSYSVYTIDKSAEYSIIQDISDSVAKVKMEKYLTPKYKCENDYRQIMQSLNTKQRKYCIQLLHHMKHNPEPVYNVIIGGAGVGKSCLINAIYQSLIRYFNGTPGSKPDTLKILLCAPTGKAAFNIGGVTTNSAFDIFNQNHESSSLSHDRRNTLLSNFIDLKLIIIDEISMVGISQFEQINLRLQDVFGNKKIFGGISVLCFGDFYQLRPVQDYFVFKINSKNKYSILFENQLWQHFKAYELTEIMRQKDDKIFATALNNLASASCTHEDIDLFKSREITQNNLTPPSTAIHLFRTNLEVDTFNMIALNKNAHTAFESKAEDIAEGDVNVETKQRALDIIALKKRTETYGLPTLLILKEGSNFMVTVNIDIEDGIVNGASGILRKIEAIDKKPYKIWIEFSDLNVGMKTRQRYQYAIKRSGYENNWTPIEKLTRDIPMNNPKFRKNVRVRRSQFPLVSCEAMTINKAQGQSYDEVVVNISPKDKKTMLSHVYVALSRARKANGLYINGAFYQPKKTNAVLEVETEVNRLRTEAAIPFSLKFLADDESDGTKVMYHNVQSLINNYNDVINDNNYMSADILLFVETWMMDGEVLDFPSFKLVSQITSKKLRKAYGCAIYAKVELKQLFLYKHTDKKYYFNCIAITHKDTDILIVYNSSATSKPDLIRHIQVCLKKVKSEKVLVVGDFNLNVKCVTNQDFVSFMKEEGLSLMNSSVTTNGNTQIDLVFSRNCSTNVNQYESYFSYHKPMWFII